MHACTKVHIHSQLFCVFSVVDEYKAHVTPSLKSAIPWQSFTYAHGAHSRARIFKRMLFVIDRKKEVWVSYPIFPRVS